MVNRPLALQLNARMEAIVSAHTAAARVRTMAVLRHGCTSPGECKITHALAARTEWARVLHPIHASVRAMPGK